ncbi:MAG: restriction endonuclease subunit S [Lachnospiraceae bacterium]|nr:restriction endonuclease subunit S [Lachnospiraceae bacterium]
MKAQKLKDSILRMAVQGKLVQQDSQEEPAEALLERIRKEKGNSINASVIFRGKDGLPYEKTGNDEPRCIAEEIPYEIPEGWEWTRLGMIGKWGVGATPDRSRPEYYNGAIPWLKTGDLNDGILESASETICEAALKKTPVRLNPPGSVLIAMYGATIGKLGILAVPAATNQACCACLPLGGLSNEYLFFFLMSQRSAFVKLGEGGAQPNISKEKIMHTLMPVPPVMEQRRIVKRLKLLWPLLEKLEAAEDSLEQLNAGFPDRLEKSILRWAVQGKLVPRDLTGEPAGVLLERIRKEKELLVKTGKIKRDKAESVIFRRDNSHYEKLNGTERCIDDEIPFQIPDSWEWARLGSVVINRDAKRAPLSARQRSGLEKIYDYYGASGVIDKVDRYLFDTPCLLVSEDGANLRLRNKPIAFPAEGKYWVNNHVHVLEMTDGLRMDYTALFLNAISLVPYITGNVQFKLSKEKLNSILIAIPPLEEQRRIAKRAASILALIKEIGKPDV